MAGVFAGLFAGDFAGLFAGVFAGLLAGDFAGLLAGVVAGLLAGVVDGLLAVFAGLFAGLLVGDFEGLFAGDFDFSGVTAGDFARVFRGDFAGLFAGDFAGDFFAGDFPGVFSSIMGDLTDLGTTDFLFSNGLPAGLLSINGANSGAAPRLIGVDGGSSLSKCSGLSWGPNDTLLLFPGVVISNTRLFFGVPLGVPTANPAAAAGERGV